MTTENGLEKLAFVRDNIEVLRDRLAYLEEWLEGHLAATGVPDTGVRCQEAVAIRWALPVLEAEWDAHGRILREHVFPAEGRKIEHHDVTTPLAPGRGPCSVCGREYTTRKDGTVRGHMRWLNGTGSGQCHGSYHRPASAVAS